jgi:hypothetical protein
MKELIGPVERERLGKTPWARSLVNDLILRIANLRAMLAAPASPRAEGEWRTDTENAPERENVLVFWPFFKLNGDGDLTEEQSGGERCIAQRIGKRWDDHAALEGNGSYFGDDSEPGHKPTLWMPLPAAPQTLVAEERGPK